MKRSPGVLLREVNWGVVVALALSLVCWSAVVANAQGVLPASTGCIGDSVVTIFSEQSKKDSMAMLELDAHEAVHRHQLEVAMTLGQTCYEALWEATGDARTNLKWEAPAYIAQGNWNEAHRPGFDRRNFNMTVARALYFYYSTKIGMGEIFIALTGTMADTPWGVVGEPKVTVFP